MISIPSNLMEGEARALVAMMLGENEPTDLCAFIVIGIRHPTHSISVMHAPMPENAAAKITLEAAVKLTKLAVMKGELTMTHGLITNPHDYAAFFELDERVLGALDEENSGPKTARLEAISDRLAEAQYRATLKSR